jgi:hypothetical protein
VADLPTLGIREIPGAAGGRRAVVETFMPGMVLTLDQPGKSAKSLSQRLYARVEPHTTQARARSCKSCHNNPLAIGYGRGQLRFDKASGRWNFTPSAQPSTLDGMPKDAWIPFLGTRSGMVSTRPDVRPFTVEEQHRILQVGACLTCHDERSQVLKDSVKNFEKVLGRRSRRCVRPIWE